MYFKEFDYYILICPSQRESLNPSSFGYQHHQVKELGEKARKKISATNIRFETLVAYVKGLLHVLDGFNFQLTKGAENLLQIA